MKELKSFGGVFGFPESQAGLDLSIPLQSCKTIKILDSKELKFPQESLSGEESKSYFQKKRLAPRKRCHGLLDHFLRQTYSLDQDKTSKYAYVLLSI